MYQYFDLNEDSTVGLHDCRATGIYRRKNLLTFELPKGVWLSGENAHNATGRGFQTGAARVDVKLPPPLVGSEKDDSERDVTCYLLIPKKHGKAVRKEYSLKKLMRKVNEKGRTLEFLSLYRNAYTTVFACQLWWKRKARSREFIIIVNTDEIVYRWNNATPSIQ